MPFLPHAQTTVIVHWKGTPEALCLLAQLTSCFTHSRSHRKITRSVVCSADSEMEEIWYHGQNGIVERGTNAMLSCYSGFSKQLGLIPKLLMEALNICYSIFMDFAS